MQRYNSCPFKDSNQDIDARSSSMIETTGTHSQYLPTVTKAATSFQHDASSILVAPKET
jgi:hypothetical protein